VPTEQVERTIAAVIEEARAWTGRLVELPDGEGVVLEIVRDKPWMAFCGYLGDLHSRIEVNVDLPLSAIIVTYPAGQEVCRSYVAGGPERFRRLLTEQVRVRDLLEAGAAGAPISSGR
jgi:hypothetical protein